MVLRKPRGAKNPQGFKGIPKPLAAKEGRPSGNSVVYSPDREHDYPLQIPRYYRGFDLKPVQVRGSGGVLNSDEIEDLQGQTIFTTGEYYEFRYASDRSDTGYWTVTLAALDRDGFYPDWLQDIIDAAGPGDGYNPPPVVVYTCNCPDFDRQDYRYFSKFSLEVGNRDWSESRAGCDRAQGCKHVYAARIYMADMGDLPSESAPTTPL